MDVPPAKAARREAGAAGAPERARAERHARQVVPLTRPLVCRAVDTYGRAWTTQDSELIASLFTEDAIYVERVFDASATMRGRAAIRTYWERQICGKQSGIMFRHAKDEMVLDAEQRVAVVTWLAEFDNFRHLRGNEKGGKKVRFVQVAKLHFSDDATQITYLEEYAQGASGSKFNWPCDGIDESSTPDLVLRRMMRGEPGAFATMGKAAVCTGCREAFPSRAQLFKHLRRSNGCGVDPATGEAVSNPAYDPPSVTGKPKLQKVGLSVSYWRPRRGVGGDSVSSGGSLATELAERLTAAYRRAFPKFASADIGGDTLTVVWSVPPIHAVQACVNVASVLLPKHLVESVEDSAVILQRWDGALRDSGAKQAGIEVRIRVCEQLPRSFAPLKMSECQRYFGMVRVDELVSGPAFEALASRNGGGGDTDSATELRAALHGRLHEFTRFFSGGTHSFHNFTTMSPLSIAAGKKKTILQLKRVRAASLPSPWQDEWVCIKLTANGLLRGMLSKLMGTIVSLVRGDLALELVEAALNDRVGEGDGRDVKFSPIPMPTFPEDRILLVSPAMPRFESKTRLKLCLGKSCWEETGALAGCVREVVGAMIGIGGQ